MQSTSVDKRVSQSEWGYLLCIAVTANMLTPTCGGADLSIRLLAYPIFTVTDPGGEPPDLPVAGWTSRLSTISGLAVIAMQYF
jgi:hypothetical protein